MFASAWLAPFHFILCCSLRHCIVCCSLRTNSLLEGTQNRVIRPQNCSEETHCEDAEAETKESGEVSRDQSPVSVVSHVLPETIQKGEVTFVDMSNVVLLTPGTLPNTDFTKLAKIADDPVGVTGDQSLIEVVLMGKIPYYETMQWKHRWANDFEEAAHDVDESGPILDGFLKQCPKEPRYDFGEGDTLRFVSALHVKRAQQHVDYFLDNHASMSESVAKLGNWITTERNFKDWLHARLSDVVAKRPDNASHALKVLLFTENVAGLGNVYNIDRVRGLAADFQHPKLAEPVETQVVVTTIEIEPGCIGTPAVLKELQPSWEVPEGDREAQIGALLQTAARFEPDLVVVSPVSAYGGSDRKILRRALEDSLGLSVLWLGEYSTGSKPINGTSPMHSLGVSPSQAGVLVPDMTTKLEADDGNEIGRALLKIRSHVAGKKLFLFAYLHSEDGVRDFLLFAHELGQRERKQVIVVMPRMKCVDEDEKGFRNMQAMLSNLISSDGSFQGTLKVFHVGQPDDKVPQWSADEERCVPVRKQDLQAPQHFVGSVHALVDALAGEADAPALKESMRDSSILEITELEAHGWKQ